MRPVPPSPSLHIRFEQLVLIRIASILSHTVFAAQTGSVLSLIAALSLSPLYRGQAGSPAKRPPWFTDGAVAGNI